MKRILSSFLLISGILFAGTLYAQIPYLGNSVELDVEMIPSIPGANQNVTVNLASYTTDINAATITWTINGKKISSGVGLKKFNFTTGNLGEETILQIKVVSREGETSDYTYNIKPVEVDLVWQAESLVPPFYKGKPLFSHQSKITFIAIPHVTDTKGAEVDPKKLIYKWSLNGSVVEWVSGYGKDSYSFTGSLISRPISVKVEVTSPNSNINGIANVQVRPVEPQIVFYERNPLYGIQYQKAFTGTVDMKDPKEITILGMPLYAGTNNPISPDLTYKWSVNGATINNAPNQNIQVFRKKDGQVGTAKISLSVENPQKILQFVDGYFNLKFADNSQSQANNF